MAERLRDEDAGTLRIAGRLVRRLGFGAMRVTGQGIWGPPPDRQAALDLLRAVVDLGITFVDTADSYGPDVSEELIAEALHPYPEDLLIATKGGLERSGPERWHRNGRPDHLRKACEGSLRRLRTDAIDLYQLHAPDPRVPFEESVGAIGDLQREGKVRAIGLSNVDVDQLRVAQSMVGVVSVQNRYNLLDRGSQPVLDVCTEEGIAFLPWYPLAAGDLDEDATSALAQIASKTGSTAHQIALAWLLHLSPVVLPIPGTSSRQHLEENVAAARIRLTDDDVDVLDDVRLQADGGPAGGRTRPGGGETGSGSVRNVH